MTPKPGALHRLLVYLLKAFFVWAVVAILGQSLPLDQRVFATTSLLIAITLR